MADRRLPNIIITGTPGVGKTTHAKLLAELTGLRHINVSEFAIANGCMTSYDDEVQTWDLDDDAVSALMDKLDPAIQAGGVIIDWHCCNEFEVDDIDVVVVLRSSTEALFDRLKGRGYPDKKIEDNIDSEVMMVVLDEAQSEYPSEMVVECQSDSVEQMNENLGRMKAWVENWLRQNGGSDDAGAVA